MGISTTAFPSPEIMKKFSIIMIRYMIKKRKDSRHLLVIPHRLYGTESLNNQSGHKNDEAGFHPSSQTGALAEDFGLLILRSHIFLSGDTKSNAGKNGKPHHLLNQYLNAGSQGACTSSTAIAPFMIRMREPTAIAAVIPALMEVKKSKKEIGLSCSTK